MKFERIEEEEDEDSLDTELDELFGEED